MTDLLMIVPVWVWWAVGVAGYIFAGGISLGIFMEWCQKSIFRTERKITAMVLWPFCMLVFGGFLLGRVIKDVDQWTSTTNTKTDKPKEM